MLVFDIMLFCTWIAFSHIRDDVSSNQGGWFHVDLRKVEENFFTGFQKPVVACLYSYI